MPLGTVWSDDQTRCGNYRKDDIEIWHEDSKTLDLIIRFDAQKPNAELMEEIIKIADSLKLIFIYLGKQRNLPSRKEDLAKAINDSRANEFVTDPYEFLSKDAN